MLSVHSSFYEGPSPVHTHVYIDPRGRLTVMASSDNCFCTCRPSVHPHFLKQFKFQVKTMFPTGKTVGLAQWIIDDTCLVLHYLAS